jgi:hypothetical protein
VPPQTLSGQHIPHNGRQYSACGHPARTSRASSVLVAKVYILGPPSFSAYALAQLHFTASRNSKVLAFNGHLDSPGLGPHESGVLSTGWCHDTSQLVLLHFSFSSRISGFSNRVDHAMRRRRTSQVLSLSSRYYYHDILSRIPALCNSEAWEDSKYTMIN